MTISCRTFPSLADNLTAICERKVLQPYGFLPPVACSVGPSRKSPCAWDQLSLTYPTKFVSPSPRLRTARYPFSNTLCPLELWILLLFRSRTPRCKLPSTLYPQSYWYVIRVIHSLQYIIYISKNKLNQLLPNECIK
jgi:hypothetical protein